MTDTPYEILRMGEAHLSQVVRLEGVCFSDPWSIQAFRSELRRERFGGYNRVLIVEGEVRAYMIASFVVDEGHLANIAVAPEFRRRGAACALLDDLLAESERREIRWVWLEVRVGNRGAIRLYESYGFEPVSVRKNYYAREGEDALVMRLHLPAGREGGSGVVRKARRRSEAPGEEGDARRDLGEVS